MPRHSATVATVLTQRKVRGQLKWTVDLRAMGGGRHFFSTEESARSFAERKDIEVSKYGRLAVEFSDRDRRSFLHAKEKLAAVGGTIDDAVSYYLQHHGGMKPKPLQLALDMFEDSKAKAKRRMRYVDSLRNTVTHFIKSLPPDVEHVHEVTRDMVEAWLAGNDWEAITQTKYSGTLGTFFNWCKRRGWLNVNPCDGIERVMVDDKPPGILRLPEVELLLHRLLRPENRPLIPFVTVQLFAGLRSNEAKQLTWAEIGDGFIEVAGIKAKTRRRRIVTVHPTLAAWLKLGGMLPAKSVPKRLRRLRCDPVVVNTKGKKEWRSVVQWTANCLRHSFCSYHLAQFKNAGQTAVEAGHTEAILFRHYRELVRPKEAERFWGLTPEAVSDLQSLPAT